MLRAVLSTAAAHFDRAVTGVIAAQSKRTRFARAESLGHDDRMRWLEQICDLYAQPEFFTHPDAFFPRRGPLDETETAVRTYGTGGRVVDLRWHSRFTPYGTDIAAAYLAGRENHTAAARLFLHNDRPRPALVLIHGYLGGRFAMEERVWPLQWFFDRGLDLALVVLPFHGVRSDGAREGGPVFPGSDPRVTIEGFRQTVIDVRDLIDRFRARGASGVAVMGMSLGGYTTSLLATLDPEITAAIPMIPLASIADFAREHGRLVGTPAQQHVQHAALERAHAVVSPFGRPSVISPDRIRVFGAAGDRITPIDHAQRIATHLGVPLETFTGGHLLQFGRRDVFRAAGQLFAKHGMFRSR